VGGGTLQGNQKSRRSRILHNTDKRIRRGLRDKSCGSAAMSLNAAPHYVMMQCRVQGHCGRSTGFVLQSSPYPFADCQFITIILLDYYSRWLYLSVKLGKLDQFYSGSLLMFIKWTLTHRDQEQWLVGPRTRSTLTTSLCPPRLQHSCSFLLPFSPKINYVKLLRSAS